jgi:hypothetical protein
MLPRIEHPLGADRDYDFAVFDAQNQPENVTGWTFSFTVWNELSESPVQLFQLTSGAGGIVVDVVSTGVGRIHIRATDVQGKAPGRYRGILECVKSDATPERLDDIIFILLPTKPST